MVSTEVQRHTDVDPYDVPSAQWGWSKPNTRVWHFAGLGIAVFLLLMIRGNHVGRIEDWFLIAFATLVFVVVVRDWWGRRRGQIR